MLANLLKYSEVELLGQNHRILKSGFHDGAFYEEIWKTISSGKIWSWEIKNKSKDGSFYWVKTTIVPVIRDGEIVEYVSLRMDIAKEKELQDKLIKSQRLVAIGKISARIAHDLRNPLSIIANTLELLKIKTPALYGMHRDKFDRIDRSMQRISHQIDDVLDYVSPHPLILKEEKIQNIIKSVLDKIKIPNGIEVYSYNDDISLTYDSEKIEVVLVNLVMNAIHAIGQKGRIDISCTDDKENVTIQVRDTDLGIQDEDLPKIFDPLFTTKQTGTGLVLSSCKSIVERHGGKINVKSEAGSGTSFVIDLPKVTTMDISKVILFSNTR